MASSVTEYSEPWQDPDTEIGEAFEAEFSMPKQIEASAPPLSAFSSTKDLNISEAESLSEKEKKVIKMLDAEIEDSSGYSSGSDQVSNRSDEDSITDTDVYDTVYTSSGNEYSDASDDEEGISF